VKVEDSTYTQYGARVACAITSDRCVVETGTQEKDSGRQAT